MTAVKAAGAGGAGTELPRGFAAYTLSGGGETFLCVFNLDNCQKNIDLALSLPGYTSASTLVGRPSCVSAGGDTVTVSSFGPYAVRVYLLGGGADSESAPPLYNTETASSSMYLRGGFNGWGIDNPMTSYIEENEVICTADVELASGSYEFKFDSSGKATEWPEGQNWGTSTGGNLVFAAPSAGMYRFRFNFSQMEWSASPI